MGIKVLGYSERGLINSLFYELSYKADGASLLGQLLDKAYYSDSKASFGVSNPIILIEQSFSDFGDADAVLSFENDGRRQTVFVEAKVKTCEKDEWKIGREFEEFRTGIGAKRLSSSNLFTQLYHKYRLADGITKGSIAAVASEGLLFPDCSTRSPRKLGKNKIVLQAAEMISKSLDDVTFLGIVPDKMENIEEFVDSTLRLFNPGSDPNWRWSVRNWGWLNWQTIKEYCEVNGFENTLGNFKHNEEQIFE